MSVSVAVSWSGQRLAVHLVTMGEVAMEEIF